METTVGGRHWHLEKSVSLTHILSTAGLLMAMVGGYANMTSRMAVIESQQAQFNRQVVQILEAQSRIDARQDSDIAELKKIIREDYREILHKLDNLQGKLR